MVGFGQAEAADPLTRGKLGQVFLFLGFGAEIMDGHHDQRGLHTHHGAVARIHALDLARDQAVGHVVQAGAAVFGGDGGAQQTQFAHLAEDGRVGFFMSEGLEYTWLQALLAIGGGGFAHHALVFGQLLVQQERVIPLKAGVCHVVLRVEFVRGRYTPLLNQSF